MKAQQEWNVDRVMCGGLRGLPLALAAEHWREKWEVSWEQTGRALEVGMGLGRWLEQGRGRDRGSSSLGTLREGASSVWEGCGALGQAMGSEGHYWSRRTG